MIRTVMQPCICERYLMQFVDVKTDIAFKKIFGNEQHKENCFFHVYLGVKSPSPF
jgi:hypothetical protein